MHIYYISKTPEDDVFDLEEVMVRLPLILGLIFYICIIGAITCWLFRYHLGKNRGLEAETEQNMKPEGQSAGTIDPMDRTR